MQPTCIAAKEVNVLHMNVMAIMNVQAGINARKPLAVIVAHFLNVRVTMNVGKVTLLV